MANFPPYFNPYQQPMQMQTQPSGIPARLVSCREEAVAAQVAFDMTPNLFADLSHGMIYVKRFNPNTGCADVTDFKLQPAQPVAQAISYATEEALTALAERVCKLEEKGVRVNEYANQSIVSDHERGEVRRRPDAGAAVYDRDRSAYESRDQYDPRQIAGAAPQDRGEYGSAARDGRA